MQPLDLANLSAFIAIAETGSFSGAAERLFLTQPAISKRIAGLEQQLKVRLFDRLGREVGLTEAGRALLPRAYQILNVLDDTRRAELQLQFSRIAAMAEPLMAFPLDERLEIAGVYKA